MQFDILDGAVEPVQEDLPPIPKELAGVPEDIVRDIMLKALIKLWNHARELSKATVYNDIVANHYAQQQELQRMQMLQNQSVNDYNNYVAQKQATENFESIRQYATGEFFNAQTAIDKEIITDSFARLGRNMATPADMMIVRDFFTLAENTFANRNVTQKQPKIISIQNRPLDEFDLQILPNNWRR